MTVINSDRRRGVLRSVGDLFVRWREECETAALHLGRTRALGIMRLSDEAKTLGEEVLLTAMPSGAVGFIDDEPSQVTIAGRDGLTITMPNDTPDEVVAWLFRMAGPLTGRHTLASLAQAHEDRDERLQKVVRQLIDQADDMRTMSAEGTPSDRARRRGKAVGLRDAAELVTSACEETT